MKNIFIISHSFASVYIQSLGDAHQRMKSSSFCPLQASLGCMTPFSKAPTEEGISVEWELPVKRTLIAEVVHLSGQLACRPHCSHGEDPTAAALQAWLKTCHGYSRSRPPALESSIPKQDRIKETLQAPEAISQGPGEDATPAQLSLKAFGTNSILHLHYGQCHDGCNTLATHTLFDPKPFVSAFSDRASRSPYLIV
jgi:hypothetical protein